MTQATAAITDKFKNTFVRTEGRNTTELQKAYFKMGFKWTGAGRNLQPGAAYAKYICVDSDCVLYFATSGSPNPNYQSWMEPTSEVTWDSVIQAAEQVRQIKRAESKASKKRRAQRKWDATATEHYGWTNPVGEEDIVTVRFVDGDKMTRAAGTFDWSKSDLKGLAFSDIESYKVLAQPRKKRPVYISLHSTPEDKADADGWIKWNSGPNFDYSRSGPGWYGPVTEGVRIDVKQRSGEVTLNLEAGTSIARGAYWKTEGHYNDIVAYRLAKPTVLVTASGNTAQHGNPAWCVGCNPLNCSGCGEAPEPVKADTNPKKQYGVSSVPLNMWSPLASAYGALALYNGSLKYGKANFANTPVEASIYIAAALRHLSAWAAGQEFDPADGVPNLGGVLANIAILLEARAAGTLIDDRLKMDGYLKEIDALKEIVKSLNALHAGKAPKHYTLEVEGLV